MGKFDSYLYLGHGTDICYADGTPSVRKVPPGNLYVTASVCGQINYIFFLKLFKSFADKKNEEIWQNPDVFGLQQVLKDIMDTSTIHIHRPGDSYVDNEYNPVADLYKDSLGRYVSASQESLQHTYILNPSGVYGLSNLLKVNPDDLPTEKTYEKTTFPHKIGKTVIDITTFKINKEDVVSAFEYTVYPRLTAADKKPDYYTVGGMQKINQKYIISVSDLMEKYPGIHFNLLCRTVNPECAKRGALARRLESAEMFQTLPMTFEKTVKQNTPETVNTFFKTLFEGKQRPVEMVSEYYQKLPVSVTSKGARSVYEKQLLAAAKSQIETLFKPNDYSTVRLLLDKIETASLIPFLSELENKCKEEAKKSQGRKNALLQDCLEDLQRRRMELFKTDVLQRIFESKDDATLETNLNELESLLKSMSKEALEKNRKIILDALEGIGKTIAGENSASKVRKTSIYLRCVLLLKQYGIEKKKNNQGGGKRKTRKGKRKQT